MAVEPDPSPGRGEVWYADVPGDKRRPVLVLTRDPMSRYLHSVICAPITSTIREIPTEVSLGVEAGLAHPSVANFDNTLLLDRSFFIERLGSASTKQMHDSCRALAFAVGCED